jgi:hypothetical protein
MMSIDTLGNFNTPSVGQIARGRLQEEERLLRERVVQLLHMSNIIPPNSNYLGVVNSYTKGLG